METFPHIHCIWIGGIWLSALARYYRSKGYRVTGTNTGYSPLLETLQEEGIILVENGAMVIDRETTRVIYTEAIIDNEALGLKGVREIHLSEVKVAQFYGIPLLSYPEALAEVFHSFDTKIAVAWAHGKSTTSAMLGTILHDTQAPATTITGTLVKAFNGKNVCVDWEKTMVIEACEYRNAFLNYFPDIAIITNIDPDHLDFFKTEDAYYQAFHTFMSQSQCVIIPLTEYQKFLTKMKELGSEDLPDTLSLILVESHSYQVIWPRLQMIEPGIYTLQLPQLLVPGEHMRLDASLAYVASKLLSIDDEIVKQSLSLFPGSWRRMEIIKKTPNNNIFMSDYGHHPTEIRATLWALREANPKKQIVVFFEPHQYSRTYDLQDEFAKSFWDASMTYVVDIYAARDIDESRDKIDSERLAAKITKHTPCEYGGTLDNAGKILQKLESALTDSLFLLLGAGSIDELRDRI